MGSALVGAALHGGVLPISGTFLVFSDYMRPAVRLAALSGAKCIFVWSHDSVGVGEDGPTHQPVEQVMSLRLIPDLTVIRPADGNEVAGAWKVAVEGNGPVAMITSRQSTPTLDGHRRAGTRRRGAGRLRARGRSRPGGGADRHRNRGGGGGARPPRCSARRVCRSGWSRCPAGSCFEAQDDDYRDSVLPPGCAGRVGGGGCHHRLAALGPGAASASTASVRRRPAATVMAKLGVTAEAVAARGQRPCSADADRPARERRPPRTVRFG